MPCLFALAAAIVRSPIERSFVQHAVALLPENRSQELQKVHHHEFRSRGYANPPEAGN